MIRRGIETLNGLQDSQPDYTGIGFKELRKVVLSTYSDMEQLEKRIEDINTVANASRKSWREGIEKRIERLEGFESALNQLGNNIDKFQEENGNPKYSGKDTIIIPRDVAKRWLPFAERCRVHEDVELMNAIKEQLNG